MDILLILLIFQLCQCYQMIFFLLNTCFVMISEKMNAFFLLCEKNAYHDIFVSSWKNRFGV